MHRKSLREIMDEVASNFGLIIGPSGVGKGYGISAILKEYWSAETFVTGDWCRNHQQALASAGALVGDDLITAAGVEDYARVKALHGSNPFQFFIDAPRSLAQAKEFCDLFQQWGAKSLKDVFTLHIHADPEVCHGRIVDRATRQQRPDDKCPKTIRRRLGYYYGKETECSTDESYSYTGEGGVLNDVVPWLKANTNYHYVNGNMKSLEEIRSHVKRTILPKLIGHL